MIIHHDEFNKLQNSAVTFANPWISLLILVGIIVVSQTEDKQFPSVLINIR